MISGVPTVPQTDRSLAQARQRLEDCNQQLQHRTKELADLLERCDEVRATLVFDYIEKERAKTNSKVSAAIGVVGSCLLTAGHFMTSAALHEIHLSVSTVGSITIGLGVVGLIACANTYLQATRAAKPHEQQAALLDKSVATAQAAVEETTRRCDEAGAQMQQAMLQRQFVRMGTTLPAPEVRVEPDAVHVGELRVPRRT